MGISRIECDVRPTDCLLSCSLDKASSYWSSSVFVIGTTIEVDFVLMAK